MYTKGNERKKYKIMYIDIDLFRELLKENNMTITSFSKAINMSRHSVNNWLYRDVKVAKWKAELVVELLEDITGNRYDELFK